MPVCKDFERPLSKNIVTEKSHFHTALFIQKGTMYTKEPGLYKKTPSHTKEPRLYKKTPSHTKEPRLYKKTPSHTKGHRSPF